MAAAEGAEAGAAQAVSAAPVIAESATAQSLKRSAAILETYAKRLKDAWT